MGRKPPKFKEAGRSPFFLIAFFYLLLREIEGQMEKGEKGGKGEGGSGWVRVGQVGPPFFKNFTLDLNLFILERRPSENPT